MATRRTHQPKDLTARLGSQELVKRGRAKRAQKKRSPGSAVAWRKKSRDPGWLARLWARVKPGKPRSKRPAPRRSSTSLRRPGLLVRLFSRVSIPTPRARRVRSEADELRAARRRVLGVLGILAAAALAVVGRSVQLQLLDGAQYSEVSERQATVSAQIKAKRGVIKDRHGAELAITVDVDSVYAEPRRITDPKGVARKVAPILGLSVAKVERRLSADRAFTYLRRRVSADAAAKIKALDVVGLGTHPEPKRFYSNVGLAAHVLGFTNLAGVGRAGVEREFDEVLRGSSTRVPGLRDALGNRVFSEGFVPHSVLEGADLTLTLDRQIQHAAEGALKDAVTEHRAKSGVALVIEPKTGDVLALASYPTFNPNNLGKTTSNHHLNRAVSAVYEPGSTMKMVTLSAALEEGLIRPDSKIDCEDGSWRFGGRTIRDANHRYGMLTVTEIMQKSSNICSAKIGVMLNRDRLYQWLRRYGLGETTGLELPGELRGLIRPSDKWRDIALANIAFGQGIAMTPIQIVQMAATIANDGVRMRPRIVKDLVDKRGEAERPERPPGVRILSSKTAAEVTRMMTEVTKPGGTAIQAAVPGFEVAGKTGTAQKIDPVTRAYSHELYVSSFVGFVPADRPEVAILVLIDEPRASHYGGTVAGPAFRRIAVAALSARSVFPDSPDAREAFLASYRPEPLPKGRPEVGAEFIAEDEKLPNYEEVDSDEALSDSLVGALSPEAQNLLGLADGGPARSGSGASSARRMPNFAGLKLHEVLNRSAEIRCDPVVEGTGRVVRQAPRPGAQIEPGSRCTLTLAPRG